MIGHWDCPLSGPEYLYLFDRDRQYRVLVLPAWFDEANKLRRLSVEVMRRLDAAGIDSLMPDLPGCNESLTPLDKQTIVGWSEAAAVATKQLRATHVLTFRAAALISPPGLPGWSYAAVDGPKMLKGMLRARTLASRESGRNEKSEDLLEIGRKQGLDLAGYRLGADMIRQIEAAELPNESNLTPLPQSTIGGPGLWLRAEPDDNPQQADAIAAAVSVGLKL